MKTIRTKKALSTVLCVVLIAAAVLCMNGCGGKTQPVVQTETAHYTQNCSLGEGARQFSLTVADKEGTEVVFDIRTDALTVGEALLQLELIEGEEGAYGLYVKRVNGITADYDQDQTYWAFYIDGEYAMSGVDTTEIEPGRDYALRAEKS